MVLARRANDIQPSLSGKSLNRLRMRRPGLRSVGPKPVSSRTHLPRCDASTFSSELLAFYVFTLCVVPRPIPAWGRAPIAREFLGNGLARFFHNQAFGR